MKLRDLVTHAVAPAPYGMTLNYVCPVTSGWGVGHTASYHPVGQSVLVLCGRCHKPVYVDADDPEGHLGVLWNVLAEDRTA